MALTGKFTFRKSFRGKIVLQVEEDVKPFWRRAQAGPPKRRWRDATLMDLASPEMRPLIDLRFRPQFRLQTQPAPEAIAVPEVEAAAEVAIPPTNGTAQPVNGDLRRVAH